MDASLRVTPAFTAGADAVFPGGQVRLPRLAAEDRASEPQIDVVGTAFRRRRYGRRPSHRRACEPSGFSGYFTYESLFEAPPPNSDPDG